MINSDDKDQLDRKEEEKSEVYSISTERNQLFKTTLLEYKAVKKNMYLTFSDNYLKNKR